jgi:hypothetical protein
MNKTIFLAIIASILCGLLYYDSIPKKPFEAQNGYIQKLLAEASAGNLVIIKEKTKVKKMVTIFRVVDTLPDGSMQVQNAKKLDSFSDYRLNDLFNYEYLGYGSKAKKNFAQDDNNFETDTTFITKQDKNNLSSKYYISTYGAKKLNKVAGNFPANIIYVIVFTFGIMMTSRFNRYIKKEAALDFDFIIFVVLIFTSEYFASKHSGELLASFAFNVYFLKNIITFFAIYYILKKIKMKYQGLNAIEYLGMSLVIIIGIGLFSEYFGGNLISTLLIIKHNSNSIFLFNYEAIKQKGYLISPFIYFFWWIYFASAFFLSFLMEQFAVNKINFRKERENL